MPRLLFSFLLLSVAVSSVLAQAPSKNESRARGSAPAIPTGAKSEALAAAGTIPDIGSGDRVVAQGIYVKLKRNWAEEIGRKLGGALQASLDVPPQVVELARLAGVRPVTATRIPLLASPLQFDMLRNSLGLSFERYRAAQEANEELSRIIELRYVLQLHPREAARRLMELPGVEYAEPMFIPRSVAPASPNDPRIWQQHSLPQVQAYNAWELWQGDTMMTIGIVDAGIDMFHEDLAPNIRENAGEAGLDAQGKDKRSNGVDDDDNGVVDDWRGANMTAGLDGSLPGNTKGSAHGTAVAGIASAATNNGIGIAGIGNRCRFFPIKAGRNDNGFLTHAYEGLIYAARRGFKVINCSWGADNRSLVLQDLIANLTLVYDAAIVAGGGNDFTYGMFYPAGYRHVLGVGGVGGDDRFTTTWGEHVDISAPGGFTTTDDNGYTEVTSATSFSAPFVAGALALVRSRFPLLNADQASAHLRLTTDNVDGRNSGKEKFVGYGRLNIFRALSVDPFSHPAIVVDTLVLFSEQGAPQDNFSVGERGLIRLRLKNLLGAARNVRVSVAAYGAEGGSVEVETDALSIESLESGAIAFPSLGIPFRVLAASDRQVKLRVTISADNDYNDYAYEQTLFSKPYITTSTSNIIASLTTMGRVGYHDFPDNTIGDGFQFKGRPFLYEGGFILSAGPGRTVSSVRGSDGLPRGSDFSVIGYPSTTNDSTIVLSDSTAGKQRAIGLELRVRFVRSISSPDAVGIELLTKNVSGATLDSLRIGMFGDWDIDDHADAQTVTLERYPTDVVPIAGRVAGQTGYEVVCGVAGEVEHPVFYAIQNNQDPNLYDGFTLEEKRRTVSNGLGATAAGPSDISLILGKVVPGLADGAEDTTLFLFGVGTPTQNGYEQIRRFRRDPSSDVAIGGDQHEGGMLQLVAPNPFNHTLMLRVRSVGRNATLGIYDPVGRKIADLSDRLPSDNSSVNVTFDASFLPSGVYSVRYGSGSSVETRRIVLVK